MKKIGFFMAALAVFAVVYVCVNKSLDSANSAETGLSSQTLVINGEYVVPWSEVVIFREGELLGIKNAWDSVLLVPAYNEVLLMAEYGGDGDFYLFRTPDGRYGAQLVVERFHLVVAQDDFYGLYTKRGEELLPRRYTNIRWVDGPAAYEVFDAETDTLSFWKDGCFILRKPNSDYWGADLQKKRHVFASDKGKTWEFYDFAGGDCQQLFLKDAPCGYYIPQYLEPGRFLLPEESNSRVINEKGRSLFSLDKFIEVCGNFLLVASDDEEEEFYDVLFNNGKRMVAKADMAYAVVTSSVPHLPTGEIIVEKDHVFRLYDVFGKFVKEVSGVRPVWMLWQGEAPECEDILVYAEID